MMQKSMFLIALALICLSTLSKAQENKTVRLTPAQVVASANAQQWRTVDPNNILKITLTTGSAYIELNPHIAPAHTNNIKQLAREGFYEGLNMYRFVEGFVAQGGDESGQKKPTKAHKTIAAEFYLASSEPLAIKELAGPDGYAAKTGFLNGFAVAQNAKQTQTWQVHCPGVFAMARGNDINSGGTEFYVTIGNAQRYLDRNITVFGRVLEGLEHFNRLDRQPSDGEVFNPILDVQVLEDIKINDASQFRVMRTDSEVFAQLIAARKNRVEPWFVQSANYLDVCAMPIPTERVKPKD